MSERLFNALEQGLVELEKGAELDQVLAANPGLENELEPALVASQYARSLADEPVSDETLLRSRTMVLAHAARLRQQRQQAVGLLQPLPRLVTVLLLTLVFLLAGSGFFAASAKALPGDQLYTAKRTLEELRLKVVFNPSSHKEVEETFESRRIDEVQKLLAAGREEFVQFFGVVEQMNKERWVIEGVEVLLSPDTILIGEIVPGLKVEVEGITRSQGFVLASEIHLQTFAFVGYVESITPDRWQIDGKTVLITPDTLLDPAIQVGDWVVVSVRSDDFGNLSALLIDTTNLPTPTPQLILPTWTPTPTPEEPTEAVGSREEIESTPEPEDPPLHTPEALQEDTQAEEDDPADTTEDHDSQGDEDEDATSDDDSEDESDAEQESQDDDTSQPEEDDVDEDDDEQEDDEKD